MIIKTHYVEVGKDSGQLRREFAPSRHNPLNLKRADAKMGSIEGKGLSPS